MEGALQPTDLCTCQHNASHFKQYVMLCKITGSVHVHDLRINDYYIYNLLFLIKTLKLKAHVSRIPATKGARPSLATPASRPWRGVIEETSLMLAMHHLRQQGSGGPDPRAPPAADQNGNPGQSFLGQFAGKGRKWPFFGH